MQRHKLQAATVNMQAAIVIHKYHVHISGAVDGPFKGILDPLCRLVLGMLESEQPNVFRRMVWRRLNDFRS